MIKSEKPCAWPCFSAVDKAPGRQKWGLEVVQAAKESLSDSEMPRSATHRVGTLKKQVCSRSSLLTMGKTSRERSPSSSNTESAVRLKVSDDLT